MKLIDTHAHVYDLVPRDGLDIDSVVARSREAGVVKVYMPNLSLSTIAPMLAIEKRFRNFFKSMLGLHPCEVDGTFSKALDKLEGLLETHPFIAIGEVGIDLYHSRLHQASQWEAFERQVGWARAYGLPLVMHCRDAFDPLLRCLARLQDGSLRGVIHCFTGNLVEAYKCLDLGFHIGIGGIATYKNGGLDEVVKKVPLDKMLLETDTPYLAPVPKRGKVNEPSYLCYVASRIAEVRGIAIEEVGEVTTSNALDLFEGKV